MKAEAKARYRRGGRTALGLAALGLMLMSGTDVVLADTRAELERDAGLGDFALASGHPELALVRIGGLQGDAPSWVEARALVATGQFDDAKALLTRQLDGQNHRGDAAMLLARIAVKENELQSARAHFQTAARLGFGETRQQALYELASMELADGKRDRAGQLLAGMESGYWAALGYMNLAASYSDRDRNAARPLVALRVALAMSEQDGASDRSVALRNRLLVRAGYLSYQQEEYEKAIGFLEQVPLDSYQTPRALYLHGLALAARDNHRAAMQSWHRAKKYPLAHPGVEDAWLGMGRGYDLSGYLGQAGEAYLAANASYESERVTLRKLAERVRAEGAWKALIEDARDADTQWFLADSRTLTQPRMAYLLRFMEESEAQRAVKQVAEMVELETGLAEREHDLQVFRGSLDTRLTTAPGPGIKAGKTLLTKAEALRTRLEALKDRSGKTATRAELAAADRTLTHVEEALATVEARAEKRNAHLRQLKSRVDAGMAEVKSLRSRARRLRQQAEASLNERVLAYVGEQDERMVHALDKSEQQIAHLYEYLALESLERGNR
ncbi:MAG: tetratricopeptide repeat protein [Pseudomonadota bacterium]